jgi:nucleotide-binding universal stress UspA family protein
MFKKILVPVDGSELSTRAARTAMALAKEQDASIVFLHVTKPFLYPYNAEIPVYDTQSEKLYNERVAHAANDILNTVRDAAKADGIACESITESNEHADAAIAIVVNTHHCDLVVIATHGRGAVARFFMGSVTTRLLPGCPVPVLVYRDQSMVLPAIGAEDD